MGFSEEQSTTALQESDNNIAQAIERLFS